jgi:hypothetical protein
MHSVSSALPFRRTLVVEPLSFGWLTGLLSTVGQARQAGADVEDLPPGAQVERARAWLNNEA